MKKVLFISYFFPPLTGPGAQRVTKFVKYLNEFGWNPLVLTVNDPYYREYSEESLNDINSDIAVFLLEFLY